MASKTKITPQKEEVPEKEGADTPPDCPPLDLSDAAVKKLIRNAKKHGYVTVRAQRRQGIPARYHRSRSDLCRARRQGHSGAGWS